MRSRHVLIALGALLAPATLLAGADAVSEYGLDREMYQSFFFRFVSDADMYPPRVPAAVRRFSASQKVAAVNALGKAARAYFESKAFREQWEKEVNRDVPEQPKPLRTPEQIIAEQKAELAESAKELAANIKSMPPEMQAQMRETMAQIEKNLEELRSHREQLAAEEKERYQREMEDYRRALAENQPADPKAKLRDSLTKFLESTQDVPKSAELIRQGRVLRFADPALEGKPSEWKLAFRAGPEALEAARAFGRGWLAELK